MRGHAIMRRTRELIEAQGYTVIYGDTDSTFVWLKRAHDEAQAGEIGRALVQQVNQWWREHLRDEYGLDSALELQYETHYKRFLMPTIRGAGGAAEALCRPGTPRGRARRDGLQGPGGRAHRLVAAGPRVSAGAVPARFRAQAAPGLCEGLRAAHPGRELDDQLVYRKRLRRPLDDYQRNVPPHVRAARMADEFNDSQGGHASTRMAGWISYVMTLAGPEPWKTGATASTTSIPDPAAAAGGRCDTADLWGMTSAP